MQVLQEERLDRVVGIDCIAAEYLSYLSGFSLSAISIWLLGLRPSILEAERWVRGASPAEWDPGA